MHNQFYRVANNLNLWCPPFIVLQDWKSSMQRERLQVGHGATVNIISVAEATPQLLHWIGILSSTNEQLCFCHNFEMIKLHKIPTPLLPTVHVHPNCLCSPLSLFRWAVPERCHTHPPRPPADGGLGFGEIVISLFVWTNIAIRWLARLGKLNTPIGRWRGWNVSRLQIGDWMEAKHGFGVYFYCNLTAPHSLLLLY